MRHFRTLPLKISLDQMPLCFNDNVMNVSDAAHTAGFLVELGISGELISVGQNIVAANANHEPRSLDMLESGYLDKEPISFEFLKGYAGSTATIWIDSQPVPQDLRGLIPAMVGAPANPLNRVTYKGVVYKIFKRTDAGDRWVVFCTRANVAGLGSV